MSGTKPRAGPERPEETKDEPPALYSKPGFLNQNQPLAVKM